MENHSSASSYLPWQTPGLKMKPPNRRLPLMERTAATASTSRESQESPLPTTAGTSTGGSNDSYIWRTRSLDDGRSSCRKSTHNHSPEERRQEEQEPPQHTPSAALHSSFDAALLDNDFHSIFRVAKRRASASAATLGSALKQQQQQQQPPPELTPHSSCGRKHLRQQATVHSNRLFHNCNDNTELADDEEDELACPGTVRKLARHNSNESIKSKGTPVRHFSISHQNWRTNTTISTNNTSSKQPASWKPPLLHKFPLTPTAPSTATTLPTTQPDETTEPFRFTSFPASLPRVHPRDVPDSVRKRMMFPPPSNQQVNHSREEDGTQNTSISSLSTHGEDDARMQLPPVHTRLFLEEEQYAYSDDDDDDEEEEDGAAAAGRTRLNFNMMLSSPTNSSKNNNNNKEESPFKDLGEAAEKDVLKMPLDETEEPTAPTDLSRPYEQRHVHSFPSTMSSHSPLRNLSGYYEDTSTTGLPGGSVQRNCLANGFPQGGPQQHHHHNSSGSTLPSTPEEVQMHFQFDAVGCSPIPGIPEEEELVRTRPAPRKVSRLPPKPHAAATKEMPPPKSGEEDRLSFSSTAESVASSKRRFRPMPDMSAFEMDAGSKQSGGDDTVSSPCSPKQRQPLCPPTPVRTPVWAQPCIGVEEDDEDLAVQTGGERPCLLQKHHRSNSLIMTRVLATCSPQTMEPDYNHHPEDDDDANKNQSDSAMMDQDMELNESSVAAVPQHPEAPPAIRRSVREMGSIVSFETDFEVHGILGKGAFADVYKVRSKFDGKLYAVKRNRRHFRGKRDRELALAEVRSMQRLQQHANSPQEQEKIIKSLHYLLFFYRAWQEDGHFFCQTELCCRDTCRELMDCMSIHWAHTKNKYPSLQRHLPTPVGVVAGGPFDVGGRLIPNMTVWKICHDICAGLSHIHSRGIVHNDIKPSNIFFVAHHKLGSLCKIGDLGMAAEIGTSEDGQEGDQMYMPPELLNSAVKQTSADIFSLGLTLYEMAAGLGFDLPKQGPRWHELRNGSHLPELPPSRDPALSGLIQQMISPTSAQRPVADTILKHDKVSLAGRSCDEFLRDYIHDIEEFDRKVTRGSFSTDNAAEDQTPRAGTGANAIPCRARVCSPTLAFSTAAPNIMFTPEAT
ncbi:associated tyrosine- and threonine-specific cdc2-inhibitory kinase [Seminavis robusta]|uniref:Associated tyrosine- and threonine-specific cdc2-inhibitory kinase n=1 Tax=Seminavis robusta TaxID=568900 RepID=A0A9N8HQ29_9STRA|nr:associated tyrosine- and threonine-specific cdc2-inhibitory kinase [Seminavis robusta]|eukprot:Sro1128_g244310.1 associated tyrosine- and threonine-specific cdc2-inhibitory kinase (1127) ;mRNA; r:27171-30649